MVKTIQELKEKYDLELEKIIRKIKNDKAKLVLLQFPDGLKPYANVVVDFLKEKTNAEFLIWFESCFGACDVPVDLENLKPKIDLVVQIGHNSLQPTK
ncbi:diphthamide synthesis protein [Candidatus Pacearchaeota archaeon]|nr:diphthamide synthesis protein [Candidatus Pacearchaeota archaeon]